MDSQQFIFWMKGFVEACHEYAPTPKQWDKLKETLDKVEDLDIESDTDQQMDDWYGTSVQFKPYSVERVFTDNVSSSFSFTTGSTSTYTVKVWNDMLGNWHYTNYPEGFGYYHNPQDTDKKEKQQLND